MNESLARLILEKPTSSSQMDPLYIVIPMTVLYSLIFLTGVIGNVSTCIVIARNRHMHTATNYYLFSLAISDLLLLISGLPQEMYQLWSTSYVFGEAFCVLTGLLAETCANATVLTITAFTVERYVAICHPFFSHTVSKLSRAIKFVIIIWLLALILAVPQVIQFGVVLHVLVEKNVSLSSYATCTVIPSKVWMEHSFEISSCVFFIVPMTLITCLYILIALKLRRSRIIKRPPTVEIVRNQNHVIRMLVAVVVAFFICWAPFHAQRLLAIYGLNVGSDKHSSLLVNAYTILTHISGVLYYVSTTVNPVLYNIMSLKFRDAFKCTLSQMCGGRGRSGKPRWTYSMLSRGGHQTTVGSGPHRVPSEVRRLRLANKPATISNSSLQDVDEAEYTGPELANYMGQLNSR
ncbi:pyrokinin-1 receptor-like [Rhodnius prolixus]